MSGGLSADDLEAAVAAGIIDRDTLQRMHRAAAARAGSISADDETFRLLTGFNDIFVTIGLALFLGSLAWLFSLASNWLAAGAVAIAAWLLAEVFTRKRRMALPSIALLLSFCGSVFAFAATLLEQIGANDGLAAIVAGLTAAAGAFVHWRRFHVPVTVAAGYAAAAISLFTLINALTFGLISNHPALVILPLGLGAFALAMWFDMSDRERRTRRTDIAFWLHLAAAPAIVHSIVWGLITPGSDLTSFDAIAIVALFIILALVALVADRRALMVSALSYLIYAMGTLLTKAQWAATGYAMATLTVGAIVLALSLGWRPLRAVILRHLPAAITQKVPQAS